MHAVSGTSIGLIGERRTAARIALAIVAAFAMVFTLMFAPPPPAAVAATDDDPSFVLNQNDLEFILRQIQISEAHAYDVLNPSSYELLCTDQGDAAQNCVSDEMRPKGVRTVDGSFNNLRIDQSYYGASDVTFPRLLPAEWRQAEPEATDLGFDANTPEQMAVCEAGTTCYKQTDGNVYDSDPRVISNIIVDQTTDNPAIQNQLDAGTAELIPGTNRVLIPNTTPDEELSAPFNTFMGFFGQFFDHGLDLVRKGGNGTMIVPLNVDDPLYCPPSGSRPGPNATQIPCNPEANYITLSRATRSDQNPNEHLNLTTPFIDQNQTYSSHPAHQVFLREYVTGPDGAPVPTGKLIEGENGGMAKWRDVKRQAAEILGLRLTDADLLDVPQVAADLYGNFLPGPNGFPQFVTVDGGLVEGTPGGTPVPANVAGTGHAFLDDIAHGSTPVVGPDGQLLPRFNEDGTPVLGPNGQPVLTGYDNATLDEHFIAGDGRVNENIGLTAVHAVFHAEHNRMVEQIEDLLNGGRPELEAQDSQERGGIVEFANAFRGLPHRYVSDKPEENLPGYMAPGTDASQLPAGWNADDWSYEERLFQAAKFATEMQYQHLVFEEFARTISPNIDAVVFNENSYNAEIDPSITAEFAHVVYRFGHSMMTEEIGREPTTSNPNSGLTDVPLLTGFLNPTLFDHNGQLSPEEAAGSLINGMTARVGNAIDEHVTDVLRNNLLGLPLDLATLNLLRGRDTGVPPLQAARAKFYEESGDPDLAPYTSWDDFGRSLKNGNNFGRGGNKASLVNFVAAYGEHPTILAAQTVDQKRAAAALLVNGAPQGEEFFFELAGPTRFDTAAAISQSYFASAEPGQPGVPVVYITTGYNFPDALAGGPLAARTGGPILLVNQNGIPPATAAELIRLKPERIVVFGSELAVSANVFENLDDYLFNPAGTNVERMYGETRYDTAVEISRALMPAGNADRVYVTTGVNFPDSLAVSTIASRDGDPILLTQTGQLPAVTRAELQRLAPDEVVILGSELAVNATVFNQVRSAVPGADVRRVGGETRYDTAAMLALENFGPAPVDTLYLSTGTNFPDGLAVGPIAGLNNSPVLLVPPTGEVPQVVFDAIAELNPGRIVFLGDINAITAEVRSQMEAVAPSLDVEIPEDRLAFMYSTIIEGENGQVYDWSQENTGLEDVDFWVGGLAERLNPFGGMLGSTFNFVFEQQLEKLQFGDRFYYLFRNEGEQLFAALEANSFSDLIQRNTDASHLPANIFSLQDPILDIAEQGALPADQREPGLSLINGQWRWQGDEHVEMHGTPGNDNLRGDEGDDAIWGYDGNDRIEGGSGDDVLVGGKGDDIITDLFGDDVLKGGQGNDAINVGVGIDLAHGGLGDDFLVNGGGDNNVFFAGMGDDIILGTTGRITVVGGEHDDWIEGGSHFDLLQGDNADQFQNDTLGGNDVVAGRGGNDDVEGEGGDDILIGGDAGTDRNHGGLGWDWITYYGHTRDITADWAFNRVFEPNNPLPSRFDHLEAMSGGSGNDTLRGPIAEPDDLAASEIELSKATEESLARIDGLVEMLRPTYQGVALGDFSLPFLRGAPESDNDGVNKIFIGGPGNDVIEGRGGNDYLDGDKMLVVQLTDGENFYDSAAEIRAAVFAGTLNPGDLEIHRAIVDDPNAATSVDTAFYRNTFDSYTITPIGPIGSGYWRVEHTQVQEAEESDGIDIIRGFERLQFTDGCAELSEDGTSWVSCDATAAATLTPVDPVEDEQVTAQVWEIDENGNATDVPFDLNAVTNVRYAWWAGEGDTPDTITEWEELPNPLGSGSNVFVPRQDAVGMFLRVTVSYTDANGQFRTATSAVSNSPVADGPNNPGQLVMLHANPLTPGVPIPAGVPTDADGGIGEESTLTYQWYWTTDDPSVVAEPTWTLYPPDDARITPPGSAFAPTADDIGRWIRVTILYTDAGGHDDQATAWTSVPVTPAP